MKTLKVVLQEVISGVKAWANDNFSLGTHVHGNIANDGKVGTTANLPLITGTGGAVQAGAFGNQANTFCEGNDSRLSDARTPLAHTHTKSEVTDLLNSNFIPSANNSYDLGSSSYQWNNLYAKNYYYNGVAWGLDKANTWSQINDFKTLRLYGAASNNLIMYPPSGDKGDSSTFGFNIICSDKNLGNYAVSGVANIGIGQSGGTSYVALNASTKGSTDNNIHSIQIGLQIAASDNANTGSFYPSQNGGINLGTSTNKWKTFNGVNPGSLSFPSSGTTENTDWFNVAGSILPAGGNATDFTGGQNFFTPSKDGWLCLVVKDCSYISVWDGSSRIGQSLYGPDTTKNQQIILPVLANHSLEIRVIGSSWYTARLFMPKGNV